MSNDRELLELAAKAAGLTVHAGELGDWMKKKPQHQDDPWEWWNPLEDDGDALRLAVRLGLEVGICLDMPLGDYSFSKLGSGKCVMENHQNDPVIATRRAIVRAAAEIGKNLDPLEQ